MTSASFPAARNDAVYLWRVPWQRRNARDGALPLVANLLGVPVGLLVMHVGEHGKPRLAPPFGHVGFSWSHSGDEALLAVGVGLPELGVDLERHRPRRSALELARRFFAPAEADALAAMAGAAQLAGFLALWTAKEAVLKAHGGGLVYGLHRVAFTLGRHGEVRPDRFDGEIGPVHRWQVTPLDLGADRFAHVAWAGPARELIFMNAAEPLPPGPV
jgi:4'-phosphopantetheinyl transferase